MKMNKTLNKILTYIKMSLLLMVLGSAVIFIAGKPLATYVEAQGTRMIASGAPATYDGNNAELLDPIVKQDDITEQSEARIPQINTQYGTITCEEIALTAPLYYGDNEYSLQNGAGQYSLSAMPGEGKPILIGGHDSTFFAPLENIQTGDKLLIKTESGSYEYQVSGTKIADKSDTSAYDLTQKKEQLILYTCYPFGQLIGDRSKRYFVYCDLVQSNTEAVE